MKRILFWIGTRPEAIKLAPLILEARRRSGFEARVVCSGQHEKLAVEALCGFGIKVDELFEQTHSGNLSDDLSTYISRASSCLQKTPEDYFVVHGDTASTLGGCLAAYMSGVRVVHVEAGLRSRDMSEPFPEEANRVMVSKMASLHFAPTPESANNLVSEGVDPERVSIVGNTVVDAIRLTVVTPPAPVAQRRKVVVTAHRRENWEHLAEISKAVEALSRTFMNLQFILPLHPNPRVRENFSSLLGLNNVQIVEPMGYNAFLKLLSEAKLVITDSGGIQEEVVSLGSPCLVTRNKTERPEVLATGLVELVKLKHSSIESAAKRLLFQSEFPSAITNPVGDGFASERIMNRLEID